MQRLFVWLGGGLFVTSLAVVAYLYLWGLGVAVPYTGARAIVTDALLFTLFALHHSVFARDPVKRTIAGWIPAALLRSTYVYVASLLLIFVCWAWRPVGGTLYRATGVWVGAYAAVQIAGVALIAWSVRAIDALELAGIRPFVRAAPRPAALNVSGPYQLVRHPLYLGWLFAVFGTPQMTGDRLTFAIVTSLYLVVAIPWEERALEDAFGDAYRTYMSRVRWRLLPWIY